MASSLGKRKEREDEEGLTSAHGSTVFVSNLPYTATSTDLKTLFSDLAPVRSAFVVLEHGSGVSKGVGYVSFAIKEDAQMAYDQISKEGITLDGRSLRVQWADRKPQDKVEGEQPKKKANKPPAVRPPQSSKPADPLAIRTVIIAGLPSEVDAKTLWKKIRKLQGAEKVEWPVTTDSGTEDRTAAHALFASPSAASDAVNKLHAHVFKGSLLSATLKKRLDGLSKGPKKSAAPSAEQNKSHAPSRASRLIIRNLPWNITEQDLRAVFLPYGPIHSIDIPVTLDSTKEEPGEGLSEKRRTQARSKGFAFVWMLSRKDAEAAMEGCNGMTVQAGMAVKMVADKQKRKKQLREERKLSRAETAEDAEQSDEEKGHATTAQRVIAVDWALSKDKWEKAKASMVGEEAERSDVDMADAQGDEGDEDESDSGEGGSGSDNDEHIGVHDGEEDGESDDGSENSDAEEDNDAQEPTKPVLPPPESGTTLFVRNVPFEATDDELRTLFRAFGPLRYARITMDHDSGRSRGTGFVCFWNKTDADKAVEQSDILRAETTGDKPVVPKKNPFKLPSLLTPDPSASMAQSLVLQGRTLDVIRAVTRDEAGKLKEAGERQREKADKRNLYLLREGIILPSTPAAETMNPAEVEKRTQSYNARRALLRSNPSLYVSRTRLSVRQMPIFATERMLKRLAIHAVRTFEKQVQEGLRKGLSEDELSEVALDAEEGDAVKEETDQAKGKRKAERNTGVKQAKIVRQQDRVDPVTGKGRSRGYGFLEMMKHADALRVLRWANNNTDVGSLFEAWWKAELQDLLKAEKKNEKKDESRLKRIRDELERGAPAKSKGTLVVEFSIENVQVVQRRAAQQRDKQQKPTETKKTQGRLSLPQVKAEKPDERPPKKRRVSEPRPNSKPVERNDAKPGQHNIGSVIGRKRKERNAKKRSS
ncbi:RNA-binding domain-containing protein [Amylocystis lapponica]|nr:RNA-binding domain-containing protein [Amylocystis lapponica]